MLNPLLKNQLLSMNLEEQEIKPSGLKMKDISKWNLLMHKAKTDFESLGSTSKAIGSESSFNLRVDLQLVSSSFLPAKYQSIAYLLLAEADLSKKKMRLKYFSLSIW